MSALYLAMLTIMPGINATKTRGTVLLWAGLLGAPLFVLSLVVFGGLTPGFSHAHRAVSRLGAFDAPLFWVFDIVGLFLPGLFMAGVAVELRRAEAAISRVQRMSRAATILALLVKRKPLHGPSRCFNSP